MKKIIMMILALASLAAADVTGSYISTSGGRVDAKYGVVPVTARLALTQDGTALTGNMALGNGKAAPISSGTISGNSLTFVIVSGSGQVTGKFTQNGTTLTGTMTTSTGQIYNFVLARH